MMLLTGWIDSTGRTMIRGVTVGQFMCYALLPPV
jgi:hypothetical protein